MKLTKRDRFGLHLKVEQACLTCLEEAIRASFQERVNKLDTLKDLRINIEILKRFVRSEFELKIIDTIVYWRLQNQLEECSKMTSGWIKYLNN